MWLEEQQEQQVQQVRQAHLEHQEQTVQQVWQEVLEQMVLEDLPHHHLVRAVLAKEAEQVVEEV
jgi:DNA-binding TFAR19-related protein (PDSD5 family)